MKKPDPKKASDLNHPKGQVRAWNGDLRPARSDRWNGASDMEDQGFDARRKARGLSVTEGTRKVDPKRVKPASYLVRVPEKPPSHSELTDSQQRMLTQRQRSKCKGGQK